MPESPCVSLPLRYIKSRNFSLLFPDRNFLNGKFRMIQLWPRILPIQNAKHRKNPIPLRFPFLINVSFYISMSYL